MLIPLAAIYVTQWFQENFVNPKFNITTIILPNVSFSVLSQALKQTNVTYRNEITNLSWWVLMKLQFMIKWKLHSVQLHIFFFVCKNRVECTIWEFNVAIFSCACKYVRRMTHTHTHKHRNCTLICLLSFECVIQRIKPNILSIKSFFIFDSNVRMLRGNIHFMECVCLLDLW